MAWIKNLYSGPVVQKAVDLAGTFPLSGREALLAGLAVLAVFLILYFFFGRVPAGDFEERYTLANWAFWIFLSIFVLLPYYIPALNGSPEAMTRARWIYFSQAGLGFGLALLSLAKREGAYWRAFAGALPLLLLALGTILKKP